MAITKRISDQQERLFERELLTALRRDPEHQFAFDGKLRVFSSRYGCTLEAVNVHWDEKKGEAVFVGAFRSGNPVYDMSKGYAVVQHEIAIPFSECFEDMKSTPGFNEAYLISKTRKAVMDKCLSFPLRQLQAKGGIRDGGIDLSEFSANQPTVTYSGGSLNVQSVSSKDGQFEIVCSDGYPLKVSNLSLPDIQKIGESLLAVDKYIKIARRAFIDAKNAVLPEQSTSLSERDVRESEEKGLSSIYGMGFPLRYCDAVAKMHSSSFKDVFDDRKHSPLEIDRMVRAYREQGKPFGFKERKVSLVKKI